MKKCFILQCCFVGLKEKRAFHMKKTSVSLLIILVIGSLCLTFIPAAHSQTAPTNVKVLDYSYYFDYTGTLVVIGEVQNVGSYTVGTVYLAGSAYSSDGGKVDSTTIALVKDLLPGQKATFMWSFYDSASDFGSWTHPDVTQIDLSVTRADATSGYLYPDLKISNLNNHLGTNRGTGSDDPNADYGAYWVTGTLTNTGTQTATNVRIIVTYYNASGTAVAVGGYIYEVMNATLAPSQSTQFKIGAFDLNQTGIVSSKKITSYSELVEVDGPILQGASVPTVTPYPTFGPTTDATSGPTTDATVGPTSQDSSPTGGSTNSPIPSWVLGVVAVVVIVVVVAIVLLMKKRSSQPAAAPAKTKPAKSEK